MLKKIKTKLSIFFKDRQESDWQDESFFGRPMIYTVRSPFNKFKDNTMAYLKRYAEPQLVIEIVAIIASILIAIYFAK